MTIKYLDFFAAICAGILITAVTVRVHYGISDYVYLTVGIALGFAFLNSINNSNNIPAATQLMFSLFLLAMNSVLVFLIISGVFFAAKAGEDFSRYWIATTISLSFLLSTFLRIVLFIQAKRENASIGRNVLIVGRGDLSDILFRRMTRDKVHGFRPIAFCDIDEETSPVQYSGLPVLNGVEDLLRYIEAGRVGKLDHKGTLKVDEVWITLPLSEKDRLSGLQEVLRNTAAKIYYVPELHDLGLKKYDVDTLFNLPTMEWTEAKDKAIDFRVKRLIDLSCALFTLFLLSPILVLISLIIRLESAGPILYVQRRYGLDGKEFEMIKFRSMSQTACMEKGTKQAEYNDKRVTKFGRFIRRYSLDELPQLWNVVNGDMSIVGPRPHAAEHNEYYRDKIDGYMSRHRVVPGMTGWAQVNGYRGETPYLQDMERRVNYDLEYIRGWSLTLDLAILFKTVVVVFTAKNAY